MEALPGDMNGSDECATAVLTAGGLRSADRWNSCETPRGLFAGLFDSVYRLADATVLRADLEATGRRDDLTGVDTVDRRSGVFCESKTRVSL